MLLKISAWSYVTPLALLAPRGAIPAGVERDTIASCLVSVCGYWQLSWFPCRWLCPNSVFACFRIIKYLVCAVRWATPLHLHDFMALFWQIWETQQFDRAVIVLQTLVSIIWRSTEYSCSQVHALRSYTFWETSHIICLQPKFNSWENTWMLQVWKDVHHINAALMANLKICSEIIRTFPVF